MSSIKQHSVRAEGHYFCEINPFVTSNYLHFDDENCCIKMLTEYLEPAQCSLADY